MGIVSVPPPPVTLGSGSSGGVVAGSGTAVPGGVESTFEYNGLTMNVRSWWDTVLVTEIDGFSDADIRDSRDVNPGFHGETPFNAWYGGRTITLTGKIRAQSLGKMRDIQQAMLLATNDLSKEYPLIVRPGASGPSVMIYCRKNQPLVIKEIQADFRHMRDFQMSLRASNPRFLSLDENYVPITFATMPESRLIANLGSFPAQPRFQLVGPITTPIIRNNTTNKTLTINATLANGEIWNVDIAAKTIKTAAGVNKFSTLDVTSDWIELIPGTNQIQISGTGVLNGTTGLYIFYRHTWI